MDIILTADMARKKAQPNEDAQWQCLDLLKMIEEEIIYAASQMNHSLRHIFDTQRVHPCIVDNVADCLVNHGYTVEYIPITRQKGVNAVCIEISWE